MKENKTDYFIHKDLRRFLSNELDFYIKNEMFHLDDLGSEREIALGPYVNRIRVMKAVSMKIIDFLSQIEDFQKQLWEKKKFVIASHYCMTLDRVPSEFYAEITKNRVQFDEWKKLYGIEEGSWKTLSGGTKGTDFLKAHPFFVLDTKFFEDEKKFPGFKDRLLSSIDDLDNATGGLMVKSENWQALNLLQKRYEEQVKCIYIDPPYNTGNDDFLYKDNYQHSSWLRMMGDRLIKSSSLLYGGASIWINLDDNEIHELKSLMNALNFDFLGNIAWNKTTGDNKPIFAFVHDNLLVYTKNGDLYVHRAGLTGEQRKQYKNPDKDPRGDWAASDYRSKWTKEERKNLYYAIIQPNTKEKIFPDTHSDSSRVWAFEEKTHLENVKEKIVWWGENGLSKEPKKKRFLKDHEGINLRSIWTDAGSNDEASKMLSNMLLYKKRLNPKPTKLIEKIGRYAIYEDDLNLDYFAGSVYTAHATLNLNREDGGSRKYILVEMAGYFDSVMKPRIEKILYSSEWNDGKPLNNDGISHIFKYISLEQYEDALNNIEFREAGTVERKLSEMDDYFLRYMLDFETRDSPCRFNIAKLERPFEYVLWIMRNGVRQKEIVDLIETFNYLLGLHVKRIRRFDENGTIYRVVHGEKSGKTVTVIWRTTTKLNLEKDKKFIEEKLLKQKDFKAEQVYINGDFFVENALSVESEFQDRMNVEFKSNGA